MRRPPEGIAELDVYTAEGVQPLLVDTREAVGQTFSDDLRRAVFSRYADAQGWGPLRQVEHFPADPPEVQAEWRVAHGSMVRLWRNQARQAFIDSAVKVVPQVAQTPNGQR